MRRICIIKSKLKVFNQLLKVRPSEPANNNRLSLRCELHSRQCHCHFHLPLASLQLCHFHCLSCVMLVVQWIAVMLSSIYMQPLGRQFSNSSLSLSLSLNPPHRTINLTSWPCPSKWRTGHKLNFIFVAKNKGCVARKEHQAILHILQSYGPYMQLAVDGGGWDNCFRPAHWPFGQTFVCHRQRGVHFVYICQKREEARYKNTGDFICQQVYQGV